MTHEEKKFIDEHPDAEFIGYIKVGTNGIPRFFTDRDEFHAFRDRAWDSGHDLEIRIIK